MSRIVGVTVLLIILVDNFYDSAVDSARLHVSNVHIRKCRCKVLSNGRTKCPYPLFPTKGAEILDLIKCLCSKTNQHKFHRVCSSSWQNVPTPL